MKEVSKNKRKNRISIITFSIVIIILLLLVFSVTFIISKSYENKLQRVAEATVVDVQD